MFQPEMTLIEGLQLTAIAMLIVFSLLFAISGLLSLLKHIPDDSPKKEKTKTPVKTVNTKKIVTKDAPNWAQVEKDEEMLVASLVAAIEVNGENTNKNYKITRITRV